jgi:hypothetical protein
MVLLLPGMWRAVGDYRGGPSLVYDNGGEHLFDFSRVGAPMTSSIFR